MRILRWLPGGCSSGPTGSESRPPPGPGLGSRGLGLRARQRRPRAGPRPGARARSALLGLAWVASLAAGGTVPTRGALAQGPGPPGVPTRAPRAIHPAPMPRAWSQGVYIWDSRQLLAQTSQELALRLLHQQGMDDLLVGLTPAQVAAGAATARPSPRTPRRRDGGGAALRLAVAAPARVRLNPPSFFCWCCCCC